jgi:dTDP-4-amino-4,6-dideoxygalactose transaminase
MKYRIPFNRPAVTGREVSYIAEAIAQRSLCGDGQFTRRVSRLLEDALGTSRVLLTTSCTHALEIAALLLEVGRGDEVIVPSFTFVSTVNAFAIRGARPVFLDIRDDTLNVDETQLESLITKRTRAVVPVHYGGISCEMDALTAVARRHGLAVIEDNAHGLFGRYRDRCLGTLGEFGTLSFHETKNFVCGEGGALLINDPRYIERAEIIREKGTNRSRFIRGEVDKYTWVDFGSSYLPSDLLAAFLLAQLEHRDYILSRRRRIWEYYSESLRDWARLNSVRLPSVPSHCTQAYHLFYIILPSPQIRADLIEWLRIHGIHSTFHYVPLHLSQMGRRFGGREGQCPVTEMVSSCILRLPFYTDMSQSEQDEVVEVLSRFEQWQMSALGRCANA